jgi:hypothetical protein
MDTARCGSSGRALRPVSTRSRPAVPPGPGAEDRRGDLVEPAPLIPVAELEIRGQAREAKLDCGQLAPAPEGGRARRTESAALLSELAFALYAALIASLYAEDYDRNRAMGLFAGM